VIIPHQQATTGWNLVEQRQLLCFVEDFLSLEGYAYKPASHSKQLSIEQNLLTKVQHALVLSKPFSQT